MLHKEKKIWIYLAQLRPSKQRKSEFSPENEPPTHLKSIPGIRKLFLSKTFYFPARVTLFDKKTELDGTKTFCAKSLGTNYYCFSCSLRKYCELAKQVLQTFQAEGSNLKKVICEFGRSISCAWLTLQLSLDEEREIVILIIGDVNAGKSTTLNFLLGFDIAIIPTSPVSCTAQVIKIVGGTDSNKHVIEILPSISLKLMINIIVDQGLPTTIHVATDEELKEQLKDILDFERVKKNNSQVPKQVIVRVKKNPDSILSVHHFYLFLPTYVARYRLCWLSWA